MVKGETSLQHFRIFWDFQNLQRAKFEPSLAFLVFKTCRFFFSLTLPSSLSWVFKVCEHCFPTEMHEWVKNVKIEVPKQYDPLSRRSTVSTDFPCVTKGKFHIPQKHPLKGEGDPGIQTYPEESDRKRAQWPRSHCAGSWRPRNQTSGGTITAAQE